MASPAPTDAPRPPASFSISLGPAKPKPAPRKPAPTFAPKRSAAHLDSDDSDHEDLRKVQLVTGFDATRGGAVDLNDAPAQPQGPLVIPKLSNRNWREEAERRRGQAKKTTYLPPEALAKQNGQLSQGDLVEKDTAEQKYGLQVFDRKAVPEETEPAPPPDDAPPPKTEEEIALASLLRGDAAAPSTLVLAPTSTSNDWRAARSAAQNEDAAFKTDVASRPEMATLEDYAAVPVEEFGAALLRGMGWKEGGEVGKRRSTASKPRMVEKRPAFLGIGAKAKEEIPELGSWGKADKKRRGRQDTTYIPVVMVDKKTGKIVGPAQVDIGTANGTDKERNGDRDRDRDSKRDRSRDRGSRSERRDRERSYDSSDRRRRDRDHRDRDRREDDGRDRRRPDDRRRDDRRDRDRDRRDRR